MQARPGDGRWPPLEFGEAYETLVDEDDELVLDGIDTKSGARVVVSMRDLGEDVSAGFWDEEIARLSHVRHASAAPMLDASIVGDRFFVVKTKVPAEAVALKHRLERGPLDGAEALMVALATLEVAVELHALGLSAAGMRMRAMMSLPTLDPSKAGILVATYGLHVDNEAEVFNDLREIVLRVLGVSGGRHERGALVIPEGLFNEDVARLFRRAVGVEWPELKSARELLDELAAASGQAKRRVSDRVHVTTRPIASTTSVYGSDLLLAEEFLAANSLDETPLPEGPKRG